LPPFGSTSYESDFNGIEILYDTVINVSSIYPEAHVIIVGDLNARTGTEPDFILDDNAEFLPGGNFYSPSDFMTLRNSEDKETNIYGESLLEMCKSLDIHIANGRVNDDMKGHMTFISSRGASVIDYFILSAQVFPFIKNLQVIPSDISSHLPVKLTLQSNFVKDESIVLKRKKFIWKPQYCNLVTERTQDNNIKARVQSIYTMLDTYDVNSAVSQIEIIYNHLCNEMQVNSNTINETVNVNKEWWTNECQMLKVQKQKELTAFRKEENDVNLQNYVKIRK
jgi:hypothetical protein